MTTQVVLVCDDEPSAKMLAAMKDYNVVILGGGGGPSLVDMVADIELKMLYAKPFLEYGHYRKDFRTGKPLRY